MHVRFYTEVMELLYSIQSRAMTSEVLVPVLHRHESWAILIANGLGCVADSTESITTIIQFLKMKGLLHGSKVIY